MSESRNSPKLSQKKQRKRKGSSNTTEDKPESTLGINGKPVGYGNPPAQHTWKKGGPSPNPAGRRKGSKSLEKMIYEAGQRTVTISMSGEVMEISMMEAIVNKLYERAGKNADLKIFKYLAEIYQKNEPSSLPKSKEEREIVGMLQSRLMATLAYHGVWEEACVADLPWDFEALKEALESIRSGKNLSELVRPLSYNNLVGESAEHEELSSYSAEEGGQEET